ncbi:hypothetical protein SSS_09809 [Sarcoptes scabiei]|nr:hypothetical protein SSS_09809 [Sarcoptes scabiei]
MLDNGFPLATESNILKELIRPPNFLRNLANHVTGRNNVSSTLPTGQLSNIPWRRFGVKYTNNEAYFDVIEEIDAIIDKNGSIVSAEIQGYVIIRITFLCFFFGIHEYSQIDCCVKLSGMPDLCLSFVNPSIFDDVSFHPCIRFKRWETEKVLSFIPPDGNFRLMSYHIGVQNMVNIPIFIRQHISFKESIGGKLEIQIGAKQLMGKNLENIFIEMIMPKTVLNVNLTPNQGRYTFDSVTKLLVWDVGKMESHQSRSGPMIKGTIVLQSGAPVPDSNPNILVKFTISQFTISDLKVNRLDMFGEKYKPFKGVKYLTKTGNFQVRT